MKIDFVEKFEIKLLQYFFIHIEKCTFLNECYWTMKGASRFLCMNVYVYLQRIRNFVPYLVCFVSISGHIHLTLVLKTEQQKKNIRIHRLSTICMLLWKTYLRLVRQNWFWPQTEAGFHFSNLVCLKHRFKFHASFSW